MTCIIYKDNTLYTESLTTFGYTKEKADEKVIIVYREPYVIAYGLAGHATAKHYAAMNFPIDIHAIPSMPDGVEYEAIKVIYNKDTKKSIVYSLATQDRIVHILEVRGDSFAIGSGSPFAKGALMAGASPTKAIEIAIACDSSCGRPIKTYDLAKYANKKYAYSNCVEGEIINLLKA